MHDIQDYQNELLSDLLPLISADYPSHDEGANPEEERQRAASLAMFSGFILVMVALGLSLTARDPVAVIWFFFIYFLLHVGIAIKAGGIRKYAMRGNGAARPWLESVALRDLEMDTVDQYYKDRKLPRREWFMPDLPPHIASGLYAALDEDIHVTKRRARFERYGDMFSVLQYNAGYVGMFLFCGVMVLVIMLLGGILEGLMVGHPYLWLTVAVAIEEILKGVGWFVTPTKANTLRFRREVLNDNIAKGAVAGAGFAFMETFLRYAYHGAHPVGNLAVRLCTALPLHMAASAVFFCGVAALASGNKEQRLPALCVLLGAILLHVFYNLIARWIIG